MTWLKHTYATQLGKSLYSLQAPEAVSKPSLTLFNQALANELGIAKHFEKEDIAVAYLSGNEIVAESKPIAQGYAGHQFGHFNRLGDGRAVLLGEIESPLGLYDLQLKGSGRTPYSRRGDGRATFYSMLREYLISEAMYALHIPTTRSLAVVKTEDQIYRQEVHEGAVLSRVAASHIRVGTFEFARFFGEEGDLKALVEYTIERHYPQLVHHENPALALLEIVMKKQQDLIIDWLRVGFIHGVMNTDNMAISGETIDYGPCAFMNVFHPQTVFSSIDSEGRYAYANQPNMAYWNLQVFANALLPLIDEDIEKAKVSVQEVLDHFPKTFTKGYSAMMSHKFGLVNQSDDNRQLIDECMTLLVKNNVDYTNFFTALRHKGTLIHELKKDVAFDAWYSKWGKARMVNASTSESEQLMAKNNPIVIPRNHLVEEALNAAVSGDMQPFHSLLEELASPYDDSSTPQNVPPHFDTSYQTFCGT